MAKGKRNKKAAKPIPEPVAVRKVLLTVLEDGDRYPLRIETEPKITPYELRGILLACLDGLR